MNMNNLQKYALEEQEEEISEEVLNHSQKEKPDYYLGAFDTEEKITEAYKIINKTAYNFYNSNKFLFKSNGYEPEDLVNEIHLKLLHKFKEQETPFWVDTYGNLKTICIFTLNKLIRIITQESKPLTNPLSMFTTNNDETENNMEDVLFNSDEDRLDMDYDLCILNIIKELDKEKGILYDMAKDKIVTEKNSESVKQLNLSKIFKYSMYLTNGGYKKLNLSEEECRILQDNVKDDSPKNIKSIIELLYPGTKKVKQIEKIYYNILGEILNSFGIESDKYIQDQKDYNLIIKGGSLKGLTEEDIERIKGKGGIISEDNLKVIGLKKEAKRLTEIERQLSGGSFKVINGALVKKPKALTNKEKRALQHERFSNQDNLYSKGYSIINEEPVLNLN